MNLQKQIDLPKKGAQNFQASKKGAPGKGVLKNFQLPNHTLLCPSIHLPDILSTHPELLVKISSKMDNTYRICSNKGKYYLK